MGCGKQKYSEYLNNTDDVKEWKKKSDDNEKLADIYFEFYQLSNKMRFNKEESKNVNEILDKFESLVESLVFNRRMHDWSVKDALRKETK